jgi:hypothetical protein
LQARLNSVVRMPDRSLAWTTKALRQRLEKAGLATFFYGDDSVKSLVMRAATINLTGLMNAVSLSPN